MDAELGFIQDHTTVMGVLTEVIRGMVSTIREKGSVAIELLKLTLPEVPESIPVIHFADAQELILKETGEDVRSEPDLSPNNELFLCEWAKREYNSEFLFVVGYPMSKRPFTPILTQTVLFIHVVLTYFSVD
jgi:nondiscriminating aspartyl-tRNA synthetase